MKILFIIFLDILLFKVSVNASIAFTSPLPSSALHKMLHLFQNLTVYLTSSRNLSLPLEVSEHDQIYEICHSHLNCITAHNLYFENQFNLSLHPLEIYQEHFSSFVRIYCRIRHTSVQTVLIIPPSSQLKPSLSDVNLNEGVFHWTDTLFHQLSVMTYESGKDRILYVDSKFYFPTYIAAVLNFSTLKFLSNKEDTEILHIYAKLRYITTSSRFIAFAFHNDTVQPLIACFTCVKIRSLPRFFPYFSEFFQFFNLFRVKKIWPSLDDLQKFWYQLNERRWHNLGVKLDYIPLELECSAIYETPPTLISKKSLFNIRDCLTSYVASAKNSSNFDRDVLTESFIFEKLSYEKGLNYQLNIFSIGGSFRGLKYFVLLGDGETSKRSPADLVKLLKPLPSTVWIFLGISLFLTTCFLAISDLNVYSFFSWLYWTASVLLEQGNDARRKLTYLNFFLVLPWLMTSILFRNLYSFSMFSDLASPIIPKNLPETKHDLVGSFKEESTMLISYWSALRTGSDVEVKESSSVYDMMRKHMYEVPGLYDFNMKPDIIENISKTVPIACVNEDDNLYDAVEDLYGLTPKCDTSGRFATIYYSDSVPELRLVLGLTSGRTMFYPVNEADFYVQFSAWYTYGSYFHTKGLMKCIGFLYEAGIVSYLERVRLIHETIHSINKDYEFAAFVKVKNIFGFVLHYQNVYSKQRLFNTEGHRGSNTLGNEDQSGSATLHQLQIIFYVFILLLAFCSLVIIIEWIWLWLTHIYNAKYMNT